MNLLLLQITNAPGCQLKVLKSFYKPVAAGWPGAASVMRVLHSQVALWLPHWPCFATMQGRHLNAAG